ncbi:MAG: putative septation protein SpoVG [candidate division BRC1 bacterium ADurb.Bin183]|nr:MAG: putative septation protein SpoVG [candidate division BRC1 bacterium ADurb.Bin183]
MAELEVTEVKVRPFSKEDEKLKAFATITLNDCFIVSDLKIIKGKKGLFVAMPSRKMSDGTFRDIAHPLNNDTRGMIERKVLAAYEEALTRSINEIKSDIDTKIPDEPSESSYEIKDELSGQERL